MEHFAVVAQSCDWFEKQLCLEACVMINSHSKIITVVFQKKFLTIFNIFLGTEKVH